MQSEMIPGLLQTVTTADILRRSSDLVHVPRRLGLTILVAVDVVANNKT